MTMRDEREVKNVEEMKQIPACGERAHPCIDMVRLWD